MEKVLLYAVKTMNALAFLALFVGMFLSVINGMPFLLSLVLFLLAGVTGFFLYVDVKRFFSQR